VGATLPPQRPGRSVQVGARDASFAPRDLEGLGRAFLANATDDGALFAPEVVRRDAGGLDIRLGRCPLKQAWLNAGLAQEEAAALYRVAAQIDRGLFEGAGFRFHADTYRPGDEGCSLHVRPGRRPTGGAVDGRGWPGTGRQAGSPPVSPTPSCSGVSDECRKVKGLQSSMSV
jgi:hypothetical protein